MKEQKYYHSFTNQILLIVALSLIPGIVYIVFGWLYSSYIPALVWYVLLVIDSIFGWKLYKQYHMKIMLPAELSIWYDKVKIFFYIIFSLWTLIFVLYANEVESNLHYIAIFTQLGAAVVASALLVTDKKLFVPVLLILLLPLAIYFTLLNTWYGYILSSFSFIFLGVLLYASYNTYHLIQKNDYRAKHDMLTGLYNRRYFLDYMDDLIVRLKKSKKTAYLLLIDLDHFKTINDSLGHDIGDKVLMEVADRIEHFSEETHVVARLGGDEFTLVSVEHMESEYSSEDAYAVAEALVGILKQPYHIHQHRLYLSASIGIKQIQYSKFGSHQFVKEADIAMYEAKAEGRDGVILFNDILAKRVALHHNIEQKLYFAMKERKINLYYQPLFNAEKKMIGCEVLARWKENESNTFIPPSLFISIAEKTGLIIELGHYIMEEAFKTLHEWELKGVRLEHFSINISVRQLLATSFLQSVEQLSSQYLTQGMKNKLYFEVTESIVAEDVKRVVSTMNNLKNLGISFSMDDFGTGYSSLSNLREIPIDELKIDRSFIAHLLEKDADQTMVPAILSIAKLFNIKVVAEGVETKEQFEFLVDNGCDIFQGYYFSEVLPKNKFVSHYTT